VNCTFCGISASAKAGAVASETAAIASEMRVFFIRNLQKKQWKIPSDILFVLD
jgi:hypothetical protein